MNATMLLMVLAASVQCSGTFEIGVPAGEGRPKYETRKEVIEVRSGSSSTSALVAEVHLEESIQFDFEDVRFRTVEPGRVKSRILVTVKGRSMGCIKDLSRDAYYHGGFPAVEIEVPTGEVIEYLQYRAEGTCFLRIDGSVINTDICPAFRGEYFEILSQPKTELWIKTTIHDIKGWVLIDGEAAAEACREPYSC